MTHNISAATKPAAAPKLLDRVRDRIRLKHDSKRTELAYWVWSAKLIARAGISTNVARGSMTVTNYKTSLTT